MVRVKGFDWCLNEEKEIGLTGLARKVLCKKHNSELSKVDDGGIAAVKTFRRERELTKVREKISPRRWSIVDFRIDGLLLERWLAKTLVNLAVGRKGSGKTALFIQLRDKIRSDKRNVVVDLRPEGYQLIKLKEDMLARLSEGSRQHLITAFWEYLILLEVAYKLLEKDQYTYKHNHATRELYLELKATYKVEDFSAEGDFSERLALLSLRISDDYRTRYGAGTNQRLTTDQVTELLYRHDLAKLRGQITSYLERKAAVWILFDNLDKGWSTQGVDEIDATVLRCLIDAGRKIEREMRRAGRSLHCIVFVRNDVYEHIMSRSADYGKEMRAVLDWTEPDLLREMLRLRLVSALDAKARDIPFEQIWPTFCVSHYHGEESADYLIERSLMRPRNVL